MNNKQVGIFATDNYFGKTRRDREHDHSLTSTKNCRKLLDRIYCEKEINVHKPCTLNLCVVKFS